MDLLATRLKRQLPGKTEPSNKQTHPQKQNARKAPAPKQLKITQKAVPYAPPTIQSDKILTEYQPHSPLPIVNLSRRPTYASSDIIKIHSDRKLCSVRAAIATFIIVAIIIIAAGAAIGVAFSAIKTGNSNSNGNNNLNSLSTISTGLLTSSISIGSQTGLPCSGYTQINDPTRSSNYTASSGTCDNGQIFNSSNGGSWIRFVGSGGTKIPSTSPGLYHCGGYLSSWYNNTLPTTPNLITNGTVCFESYAAICGFNVDISVVYCSTGSNNYYVYFLPPVLVCNARYCTA